MELSTQLGRRGATLRADWIPRLQNEEADALTNSDFRHFDSAKRIPVDLSGLKFNVLNHLFDNGDAYLKELETLKSKVPKAAPSSLSTVPTKKRRRKKGNDVIGILGRTCVLHEGSGGRFVSPVRIDAQFDLDMLSRATCRFCERVSGCPLSRAARRQAAWRASASIVAKRIGRSVRRQMCRAYTGRPDQGDCVDRSHRRDRTHACHPRYYS